jgi:hypothetical protein
MPKDFFVASTSHTVFVLFCTPSLALSIGEDLQAKRGNCLPEMNLKNAQSLCM